MKKMTRYLGLALATLAAGVSLNVNAETSTGPMYEITVTNITKGQSFTPLLGVTHNRAIKAFEVGEMASNELGILAESGNIAPLKALLDASTKVTSTAMTQGLLNPGETTSFTIDGKKFRGQFTLAAMLIPTNDTFLALNSVKLPKYGSKTVYAAAYDAGTETNDENCQYIPGPVCGGEGVSENDTGEGYIYPSPGISGEAELSALSYNWQGKVAKVKIQRLY